MKHIFYETVRIVKFIKTHPLNFRIFAVLRSEMERHVLHIIWKEARCEKERKGEGEGENSGSCVPNNTSTSNCDNWLYKEILS